MAFQFNWRRMARRAGEETSSDRCNGAACKPGPAMIELLDERVLLSAVPPPSQLPPPHSDQVVLDLIQAEVGQPSDNSPSILTNELGALKIIGGFQNVNVMKEGHELTDAFVKIDGILAKVADGAIHGNDLADDPGTQEGISINFGHINHVYEDTGGGQTNPNDPLGPTIQNIEHSVNAAIVKIGDEGGEDDGDEPQTIFRNLIDTSLVNNFSKVEEGVLNVGQSVYDQNSPPSRGEIEFLKIKLSDVLITSAFTGSQTHDQLNGYTDAVVQELIGLLQPTPNIGIPAAAS